MKQVAVWLFFVFVLSVYPIEGKGAIPHADKALHFAMYAVTCALLYVVLKGNGKFKSPLFVAVLLSASYGLLMEVIQGFTATRSFSLLDESANVLGALSAAGYIALKRKKAHRGT